MMPRLDGLASTFSSLTIIIGLLIIASKLTYDESP